MVDTADKILIRIIADAKQLKAGLNTSKNELKKFEKSSKKSFLNFSQIANSALGFGFANLLGEATSALRQFVIKGTQDALLMERGFKSLELQTKGTADVLIKELTVASNSMVSNVELVQTANKALALGISQNQLPELMEVATARAKVMGITATQAFNDISIGIGRQSKLILDNLGIIINLEKTYKDYAQSIGKTADQLSEFEKKQAIANAIIKESEGLIIATKFATDDNADSVEKLKTAWSNFWLGAGNIVVGGFEKARTSIEAFQVQAGDTVLTDIGEQSLRTLGQEVVSLTRDIASGEDALKSLKLELSNIGKSKIEGQAGFDVKEQEKINEIDALRLKRIDTINNKRISSIEEAKAKESEILAIDDQIASKQRELSELQLIRKVEAQNEFLLIQKQGKLKAEELLNEEQSLKTLKDSIKSNVENIALELTKKEQNALILKDYNAQALALSEQTRELKQQEITQRRLVVIAEMLNRGTMFSPIRTRSKISSINEIADAGIKPTGTTIINNIENIVGLDPEGVSNALQDNLSNQIR